MRAPSRPTTIEEVRARLSDFRSPEAMDAVAAFDSRPTDVFICTYTKSGTTWMQQVVHQLRSAGSMDFGEISVVVPWLESAVDCGIDPHVDQPWEPRAFKSHLSWRDIPRGGRYITVFRDPTTVLPSFHRFFEGWFFEPGTVSVDEFAHGLYLGGSEAGSHWSHLIDWWPQIGDTDVLALSYEDMVAAPDAVPPLVADFLGIELDAGTMGRVIGNCSRAGMAAHAGKFEEQVLRTRRDPVMGLPPGGSALKVNAEGSRAAPSADVERRLAEKWAATVGAELGFPTYAAFRAALPDPLGVRS